jgi:hypothetical protein
MSGSAGPSRTNSSGAVTTWSSVHPDAQETVQSASDLADALLISAQSDSNQLLKIET